MSNLTPNDDDIFEDYVEPQRSFDIDSEESSDSSINKVFSDVDSPFKSLLENSSLKVGFTEAFYRAAHDWTVSGYREANNSAIIDELVRITNGDFLYRQRIRFCAETIARKKTIIRFLDIVLKEDNSSEIVSVASKEFKLNFTEKFFKMFFRSLYNVMLHSLLTEIVLYKSLCHITDTQVDANLCDLSKDTEPITNASDYINNLYLEHFKKDEQKLEELRKLYAKEVFKNEE